jgi:hypothetical protein
MFNTDRSCLDGNRSIPGPSGFFVGESMWENASSPRRLLIKHHPFCKSRFSEVGHLASMVR